MKQDREMENAEFDAGTWGYETILRLENARRNQMNAPFDAKYVASAARIAARRAFVARPDLR